MCIQGEWSSCPSLPSSKIKKTLQSCTYFQWGKQPQRQKNLHLCFSEGPRSTEQGCLFGKDRSPCSLLQFPGLLIKSPQRTSFCFPGYLWSIRWPRHERCDIQDASWSTRDFTHSRSGEVVGKCQIALEIRGAFRNSPPNVSPAVAHLGYGTQWQEPWGPFEGRQ